MKRAGSIRPFFIALDFLEETGAGEAIRTLDPNLPKFSFTDHRQVSHGSDAQERAGCQNGEADRLCGAALLARPNRKRVLGGFSKPKLDPPTTTGTSSPGQSELLSLAEAGLAMAALTADF
ncbi:hypothetical protein FJ414_25900 [Mesorhizobium sp. B3-1-6]|uniref:hypothetical protein n=1 Tax=Mesorhizobium sp. B3-1-6 TaxID=2589895 RepID=UPI00112D70A5|nr:hypothetical protein [Mesorhizobium sp. B3-1-6]TPI29437.1 hypothetical protein FJ414_25900 [Mesorhizobium sp. B3-1-6]